MYQKATHRNCLKYTFPGRTRSRILTENLKYSRICTDSNHHKQNLIHIV